MGHMIGVVLDARLRSWIATGDHAIAKALIEGFAIEPGLKADLANSIGSAQLLEGGFSRGVNGEPLFVTFVKISR